MDTSTKGGGGNVGAGVIVGLRRALAATALSFFMILFFMNGMLGPPELLPLFIGLTAVYFTAFAGVVAGWFWARWYTIGLGMSGIFLAVLLAWQIGLDTIVFIWGGSHLVVVLGLLGDDAASNYDGRLDWRAKWKMDDNAVNRLGKAVMRAGTSLPYLIMAGLAPRESGAMLGLLSIAAATAGLGALVRGRTWGVFALAASAVTGFLATAPVGGMSFPPQLGAVLMATAVIPFLAPVGRYLRAR